jgi:hypothetical protein
MGTKIADTASTCQSSGCCCEELLLESEVGTSNFFGRIITGDECWIYHYDPLSQAKAKVWKKPDEQIPTRSCPQKSAENI